MAINIINNVIAALFFVCYAYQIFYLFVPIFKRKKPSGSPAMHRFAVLISARNEEAVIAQLIGSVRAQTYPQEMIKIFVCADNCTDRTAAAAMNAGAEVFERFDRERVGKGYALDFLLDMIDESEGLCVFDGFFVFDADNILEPDYIERMNETFSEGYEIVTGYRNSKNYGDNWISAGYSLWFLRESQQLNRPRYLLNLSAAVSGTGFMFSRKIIEKVGGWKYFLLTEDTEFTVDQILSGEKIGYCERAVLYDEQPTDLRQSVRQRMRWSRGYLQVLRDYGGKLIGGIFSKKFFICFDMVMSIMPAMYLSIFLLIGGVTLIGEWRRIHTPARRKAAYLLTFPLFMLTYIPISVAALFVDVGWKPIVHTRASSLAEIKRGAQG